LHPAPATAFFTLNFWDPTAAALSTIALPVVPPTLADWSNRFGAVQFNQQDSRCFPPPPGGACKPLTVSFIQFSVDSLTPRLNVLPVTIDIKPGSNPNSINLQSAGVIPVAILSTTTFDATTIDPSTVALAGASVKLIGKSAKYACGTEDANQDGILDLVCHVYTAQFMVEPGQSTAVLEATTLDGTNIRGEDQIKIVP
jgi:hypothetical protein